MNNEAELPLEPPPADPRQLAMQEAALMVAFRQSGVYRHGITFEKARNFPALMICLTTAAEIKVKRLLQGVE